MRKMHSKEELEALSSGGGGVSYSTEEQDTGLTWIDGKKIYQRTFIKTNVNASTAEVRLSTNFVNTGIIEISGIMRNGPYKCPIGSNINSSGVKTTFDVDIFNDVIHAYKSVRSGDSTTYDFYITIKYTKTE